MILELTTLQEIWQSAPIQGQELQNGQMDVRDKTKIGSHDEGTTDLQPHFLYLHQTLHF